MKFYKYLFIFIISIWVFIYFFNYLSRIYSKFTYYKNAKTINTPILENNQSIEDLIENNSEKILPNSKVIFISKDGLSYFYYNLLSYPIIAEWKREYDPNSIENYDFVIIYGKEGEYPIKNGVYRNYDIN